MRTISMMPTHPITEAIPTFRLFLYTRIPNTMASRMNSTEMTAVDKFASRLAPSSATPAALVFPNVDATMDANAATTRSSVSHAKVRNSRLAFCPIVSRMTSPIDWPRLRIDANRAPKSWTPPKKTPPTTTQRSTGTHPKIAAWIGPLIGPAPAMDEK